MLRTWKTLLAAFVSLTLPSCATDRAPVRDPIPTRPLDECGEIDLSRMGRTDIALVIETSAYTADASGVDIDGNGNVGKPRDIFWKSPQLGSTDPADSLLSAQVIAANSLAHALEFSGARFSVVTYSASSVRSVSPVTSNRDRARSSTSTIEIERRTPYGYSGRVELPHSRRPTDAVIETQVTSNSARVRIALANVYDMKGAGGAKFSSAMHLAVRSLETDSEADETRRKVALMTSVAPTPRIFDANGTINKLDPVMKTAAQIAIDSGVAINTFGLAEAAGVAPPTTLSRIAGATGGTYYPIQDATKLYCEMLRAVIPPAPPTPL